MHREGESSFQEAKPRYALVIHAVRHVPHTNAEIKFLPVKSLSLALSSTYARRQYFFLANLQQHTNHVNLHFAKKKAFILSAVLVKCESLLNAQRYCMSRWNVVIAVVVAYK